VRRFWSGTLGWLDRLATELGLDRERLYPLLLFLLALHDIGKISRPFQAKAPEHWPAMLGRRGERKVGPRHDAAGLVLLACAAENALDPVLGRLRRGARSDLLAPFMGHHGRPVPLSRDVGTSSQFGDECLSLAQAFIAVMHDLFRPAPLQRRPKGSSRR
jgi:CRISPR-associated endonuclease/helicase Cas3